MPVPVFACVFLVLLSSACGRRYYDDSSALDGPGVDLGVDAGSGDAAEVVADLVAASICDGLSANDKAVANGHCYTLHAGPVNFDDALAACVTLGGNLAELTTPEEEMALRDTGIDLSSGPWIGIQGDGSWRWMSESPVLYSNWSTAPSGDTNNRGFIDGAEWGVDLVDNARSFMCEFGWTRHPDGLVEYEAFYEPFQGWVAARDLCATHGGDLAVLADSTSFATVSKLAYSDRWIGANANAGGDYVWLTGGLLDDLRWATNEPTGSSGCVTLRNGSEFVDNVCSAEFSVLCQRPVQ